MLKYHVPLLFLQPSCCVTEYFALTLHLLYSLRIISRDNFLPVTVLERGVFTDLILEVELDDLLMCLVYMHMAVYVCVFV